MTSEFEKLAAGLAVTPKPFANQKNLNTLRMARRTGLAGAAVGATIGGIGGALSEEGSFLGGAAKGGLIGGGIGLGVGARDGHLMQSPSMAGQALRSKRYGRMGPDVYHEYMSTNFPKSASVDELLDGMFLEKAAAGPLLALAPMAGKLIAGAGARMAAKGGARALLGGAVKRVGINGALQGGMGAMQAHQSGEGLKGALVRGGIGAATGAFKNPYLGMGANMAGNVAADKMLAPV